VKSRRPARPDAAPDAASSPARFNPSWLRAQLRALIGPLRGRRLCLAYSGGLDSTALLCALAALKTRQHFHLRALHVNHQLQPQSRDWARSAQRQARRLRVACEVMEVRVNRTRGESLEAVARESRYRALAGALGTDELLLTAHHQDDQLETVLLALLRGSGVRGLSAMGAVTRWSGTLLLRPLLPVGRAQLAQYLDRQRIAWSEDPSNADERYDRNYLRRVILPALHSRWPACAVTVARSAAHLAEARTLLEQLAGKALLGAHDGVALRISVLRRLSLPQRRNALRQWIAGQGLPLPDQRRLREMTGPLMQAREDAAPVVVWDGAQLRRHGDRLYAFATSSAPLAANAQVQVQRWDWRTQPWLSLGPAGAVGIVNDPHGEVRLGALPALLDVRFRTGGERLRASHGGHIALKDLLQAKHLAPWERAAVPLVMHAQRIVAVADLWLDPSFAAAGSQDSDRGRFRWRRLRQRL
jgi:tRNA(Ile)-lysidine synthase